MTGYPPWIYIPPPPGWVPWFPWPPEAQSPPPQRPDKDDDPVSGDMEGERSGTDA